MCAAAESVDVVIAPSATAQKELDTSAAMQKSQNTSINTSGALNDSTVVRHLTAEQAQNHRAIESKVDEIISKLTDKNNLTVTKLDSEPILQHEEVEFLIAEAKKVIESQPLILNLSAPIKIFGDLHGQYMDLLRWLDLLDNDIENTLFLGDYVDRGNNSIETICLLLAFKLKYPLTVFLLRGNHETATINRIYGFYDEVKKRYNRGQRLYKNFTDLFNVLPLAAIVEDKIFCCHGGLPQSFDFMTTVNQTARPFDVPDAGPITDLLWADPDMDKDGFHSNDRGVSITFGKREFKAFMQKFEFDLMVRAHQVCEDGYEFFCPQCGVTVFSAPNYCGEFDNAAAILIVNADLKCSFKLLTGNTGNARIQYRMPTNAQMRELEKRLENSASNNP